MSGCLSASKNIILYARHRLTIIHHWVSWKFAVCYYLVAVCAWNFYTTKISEVEVKFLCCVITLHNGGCFRGTLDSFSQAVLGSCIKVRKATISFVMFQRLSILLSVHNSAHTGQISVKFYIWDFFENMLKKVTFY